MEIKNLETFIQTAELGGFTKAAEKLGYSQSTVSFQIRQLEEALGIQLFERVNHTVKLTARGSEILALCHEILKLTGDMKKVADGQRQIGGHIRIATASSLCHWLFGRQFEAFHRQYPGITLKVTSASTEEMFRLLNQNETDLVYTLDKHIYNQNYRIAAEKQVSAHFIASSRNPLCGKKSIYMAELADQPFILTEKGMSYRKLLEEHLASRSLEIRPFLEIGDTPLICRLVGQDMGLSFLPDFVTQKAVETGEISRLDIRDFYTDIWVQLLYHRDKWCSPEMQCVINYLSAI